MKDLNTNLNNSNNLEFVEHNEDIETLLWALNKFVVSGIADKENLSGIINFVEEAYIEQTQQRGFAVLDLTKSFWEWIARYGSIKEIEHSKVEQTMEEDTLILYIPNYLENIFDLDKEQFEKIIDLSKKYDPEKELIILVIVRKSIEEDQQISPILLTSVLVIAKRDEQSELGETIEEIQKRLEFPPIFDNKNHRWELNRDKRFI